jgi:hypothetical protein
MLTRQSTGLRKTCRGAVLKDSTFKLATLRGWAFVLVKLELV